MKQTIDFLVIGAQKSGTTSLFKYMQPHPSIYLPSQKEINFFANPRKLQLGLRWYIDTYFSGADERKLWGEASPAYMGYTAAPANIRANCPHVKLVAIVRNPIDRAYSHYRMSVRRGTEDRPFRQVVEDRRSDRVRAPETLVRDDSLFLLEFSLYGEILQRYLRYFEGDELLILFQEDFVSRPGDLLAELFSFLGVDAGYRPPNLGQEYHVGGDKRLPWLDEWVRRRRVSKWVLKKALRSKKNVEAARFWFKQFNIKPEKDEGPAPEDRELLREFFEEDVALLKRLFSVEPPWPEFEGAKEGGSAQKR